MGTSNSSNCVSSSIMWNKIKMIKEKTTLTNYSLPANRNHLDGIERKSPNPNLIIYRKKDRSTISARARMADNLMINRTVLIRITIKGEMRREWMEEVMEEDKERTKTSMR